MNEWMNELGFMARLQGLMRKTKVLNPNKSKTAHSFDWFLWGKDWM